MAVLTIPNDSYRSPSYSDVNEYVKNQKESEWNHEFYDIHHDSCIDISQEFHLTLRRIVNGALSLSEQTFPAKCEGSVEHQTSHPTDRKYCSDALSRLVGLVTNTHRQETVTVPADQEHGDGGHQGQREFKGRPELAEGLSEWPVVFDDINKIHGHGYGTYRQVCDGKVQDEEVGSRGSNTGIAEESDNDENVSDDGDGDDSHENNCNWRIPHVCLRITAEAVYKLESFGCWSKTKSNDFVSRYTVRRQIDQYKP